MGHETGAETGAETAIKELIGTTVDGQEIKEDNSLPKKFEIAKKYLEDSSLTIEGYIVKWIKTYGFMRPEGEAKVLGNLFVHKSKIISSNCRINVGQRMKVKLAKDEKYSSYMAVEAKLLPPGNQSQENEELSENEIKDTDKDTNDDTDEDSDEYTDIDTNENSDEEENELKNLCDICGDLSDDQCICWLVEFDDDEFDEDEEGSELNSFTRHLKQKIIDRIKDKYELHGIDVSDGEDLCRHLFNFLVDDDDYKYVYGGISIGGVPINSLMDQYGFQHWFFDPDEWD